jgi:two-component system response regulator MprA
MSAVRIGLCEDDADLRSVLTRALRAEGFEVRATMTGHEAVEAFSSTPPDLLVLDIGLPDADGRDVCQALRAHGVSAPVVFLTARDALPDRLSGFHAGGDDYLTKPFALTELVVRVRALLRRAGVEDAAVELADGLRLDPAAHAVRAGEQSAALTPTEFRILAALAARPGAVVRRGELTAAAWPDGAIVHANTLDAYIGRLRRKLTTVSSTRAIETIRGVGYSLR